MVSRTILQPPGAKIWNLSHECVISITKMSHYANCPCCARFENLYCPCKLAILCLSILSWNLATSWCHVHWYPTGLRLSCPTHDNPSMYACCYHSQHRCCFLFGPAGRVYTPEKGSFIHEAKTGLVDSKIQGFGELEVWNCSFFRKETWLASAFDDYEQSRWRLV